MGVTHGITITEDAAAGSALVTVATAVIGLVATAPDASAAVFPLNTPALVADMDAAIGAAGTTGTLRGALQAIADQVSAPIIVVRVDVGANAGAQDALAIAGLQALLVAQSAVGAKPRILGAPGLDSQAVTTALVPLAQKLRAFVYAKAIGADPAAAQAYRANFSARELMLIWDDFAAFDMAAAATATSHATARALGLRARLDQEQGWHKTLSNVAVEGVTGIARPLPFDIMDPGGDVGLLNDNQVTALVRRAGFRFWGNRTCAAPNSGFEFEVSTRTAQVLADTIAQGLTWAVDKPLTPSLIKDLVERINGLFRDLVAQKRVLGARAWFDQAKNAIGSLAAGALVIDYDYSPVPPLENLGLIQHETDSYVANLYAGVGSATADLATVTSPSTGSGGAGGGGGGGGNGGAPSAAGQLNLNDPSGTGLALATGTL